MFRNCIYGGKLVSFGRIFRLPDRMRCGRALLLLVSALCTAPGFAVGAENFPSPRSEASARARKATSSVQNGISVTGSIVDEDGNPIGMIRPNDVVIFFNYRNDRAKELTIVLTQEDMPQQGMHTLPLYYCCMTPYDAKFTGLHILFDKENVPDTIGEWVSKQGLRQLRIAETEKYAHVTFFFNGGVEDPYPGEDRVLVASPKVATYDLQPEMSAYEVTEKCVERIESGAYDVIILNFANCDMVGHTGVYEAAVKAVEAVDAGVGKVVEATAKMGGVALITADHGNAEQMLQADGKSPMTAHTTNVVPFILCGAGSELRQGRLADIAPTILDVMGLAVPEEMDGQTLIVK